MGDVRADVDQVRLHGRGRRQWPPGKPQVGGDRFGTLTLWLSIVTTIIALAGCTSVPEQASLKLNDGMTMQEVSSAIGAPDSTGAMTCGSATPAPWSCRLWKYSDESHSLTVMFRNDGGVWRVNNWSAY
jgi:hypothetical protein